ncbi:GNAT family N-acetyltransferase [Carnobacterium divergens]|uniref:N-acetyltransferase domain-containing protein n=1 Tax=Carnobacterium divergens TaxID=2748 RepID=A0A7Z8D0T8_CARDV|nr:GNAT family N-acetyltransferase [Carnobacterium divergens]TFI75804.1 hypothetical protein CKN58_01160 [Carnobacterium divergens]TFI79740.1 hypothetical protein CKN85_01160 [Carnobacterium divergens]TFI86000.1 hypothetical protein CKN56_01160 [Carnobacterium divergens]TFI98578.1 hypothetical protein CKN64_01160 [Carnobacterium divergens]TFJ14738.1 hypothetical protein CKN60_01155 [Carnobacterium divergens]
MIPILLKTKRLTLTPVHLSEAMVLFNVWSNSTVTKYMNIAPFESLQQAKEMIAFFEESLLTEKAVRYAIYYQNNCIGSCGFNFFDWQAKETEIGYEILPTFWNLGLGTEIVALLCQTAFEKLGLETVFASIEKENTASKKLVKKCGFQLATEQHSTLEVYRKSHTN